MVSRNKAIARTILRHQYTGSFLRAEWYMAVATCSCGWEKECGHKSEAADLYAKHMYSKIKKTMKKRKQIKALGKGTNGTR